LEGVARSIAALGLIPQYNDYTTAWYRIHDTTPEIILLTYNDLEVATDSSGLKTDNAGEYRVFRYEDKENKRKSIL
jgi:hypothetical protein